MRSWFVLGVLSLVACGNDREVEESECKSDRDFFEQKVWAQVMGKVCVRCHTLAGPAAEENARFLLQPPAYPGFLDINFQKATEVALIEIEGTSELLLKPTNAVEHGGGLLFEAGSEEHAILQEFVKRTASPTSCTDQAVPGFDDVAMLDGPQTLRKALLELVGRLPTPAEREAVEAAGPDFEGALDQVLDAAMQEDAFYARMSELWNDVFLTDRFLTFTGRATNLLNTTDWPNAANMGAYWTGLSATDRERTNTAVAREPLELINYIIRNGKPFTDVVTATYTVVNPYSAQIYGVGITFPDPTDTRDWRETQLTVSRDGLTTPWPHAGILSSPMWLNRFPTTATNRNRHRARMVYRDLLATDILAIADRPIDAATATAYLNPTREDPSCKVCHAQIDPIAGSFQKWNANDQEQWQPAANWFPEMYPPGFEGEVIPSSDFVRALPWLGDHIASDPRFSVAITRHLFKGLTGQAPAVYPQPTDASFDAKRTAFLAQEGVLAEIARNFVAANYDLRVAIKGVVHSPYFRADRALGPLTDSRAIELADLGTARLITPERLARKVEAVTGAPWVRYDRRDNLTTDYRIAYGGIDSDAIVERLTTPNGMMSGTSWRMANEVACVTTAWDFSRPPAERNLFPSVAIVDVPEAMGTPSADGAAKIRAGIVHLHQQVLGETLAPDDPEIDRTYDLWLETWREGKAAVTGGQASQTLLSACRARVDPRTGTTLPPEQQIDRDPDYTIRAWMAVLTYLLADYRFLHS